MVVSRLKIIETSQSSSFCFNIIKKPRSVNNQLPRDLFLYCKNYSVLNFRRKQRRYACLQFQGGRRRIHPICSLLLNIKSIDLIAPGPAGEYYIYIYYISLNLFCQREFLFTGLHIYNIIKKCQNQVLRKVQGSSRKSYSERRNNIYNIYVYIIMRQLIYAFPPKKERKKKLSRKNK